MITNGDIKINEDGELKYKLLAEFTIAVLYFVLDVSDELVKNIFTRFYFTSFVQFDVLSLFGNNATT